MVKLEFEGFDFPSSEEYERFVKDDSADVMSEMFGDFVHESLEEVHTEIGARPSKVKVGSREVTSVPLKIDIKDIVVAEYDSAQEMLDWIAQQLENHSPVKSGKYKKSHRLYADGVPVPFFEQYPFARQYMFVNIVPYARKIERGLSSKAPDGVYQVVSLLAARRFHDIADINYSFAFPPGISRRSRRGRFVRKQELRNPAVIVRMHGQ